MKVTANALADPVAPPDIRGVKPPAPVVGRTLLDDDWSTGFRSWVPLHDGNQPRGMGGFDGQALVFMTEDRQAWGDNASVFHASSWLSRLTLPPEPRIYLRWEWALRIYRGTGYSKGPSFGLDTDDGGDPSTFAPADGRRYPMTMRCAMFDESGDGTYYGGKWQTSTGTIAAPSVIDMHDFEGDVISPFKYPRLGVGQNYGKVLRQYTEQVLNVQTFKFEGLRHNGVGFGVLPSGGGYDPDPATNARANELAYISPPTGIDAQFDNGCNLYVQLDNRSNAQSKQTMYLYACQAVAFS